MQIRAVTGIDGTSVPIRLSPAKSAAVKQEATPQVEQIQSKSGSEFKSEPGSGVEATVKPYLGAVYSPPSMVVHQMEQLLGVRRLAPATDQKDAEMPPSPVAAQSSAPESGNSGRA